MEYSLNPFKWLVWLYRRIKYRGTKWTCWFYPKPLSRKAKREAFKKVAEEIKTYKFLPPLTQKEKTDA